VRTTYNTATTAGRFTEAKAVQDAGIPVGFRYSTAGDSDVRSGRPQDNGENHAALDGMVARADDPCWTRWSPPGGYNAVEAGALVMTDQGEKKIEEIRAGDKVWTFQGEYARVYGTDKKIERKRMVCLEMEGGHSVWVSVEHKVLTRRGWLHARNVKPSDEIAVAGCKTCGEHVPTWREFCSPTCSNKHKGNARRERKTEELASRGLPPRKGRTCKTCSATFDANTDAAAFCSPKCSGESNRNHRFCKACGLEIKTRGKKKPSRFCGNKCKGIGQRNKDRPCDTCGKSIREVLMRRAEKTGTPHPFGPRRRFCSFRCWRRFNGETSIEKTVRTYLELNEVGYVQSAQVGRYEVDFVLPTFMVAVECDGSYWHASERVQARDAKKDALLKARGFVVVRLAEAEIKAGDAWKERLYAVCQDQVHQARGTVGGSSQPGGVEDGELLREWRLSPQLPLFADPRSG
jgi:very-short-patch-repair endonuclease/predicted nucleic acid-binding Zn ribbon protein